MLSAAFLFALAGPQGALRVEVSDVGADVPGAARTFAVDGAGLPAAAEGPGIAQMPGWPQVVPGNTTFSPQRGLAFADLDGDGPLETIVSSTDGKLYAFRVDGSAQPGFPVTLGNYAQSAPSVADLDGDGTLEIVQFTRGATSGGKLWVVDHDGAIWSGYPLSFNNGNLEGGAPVLADLDADGRLEILVPERAYPIGRLHVVESNGVEWGGNWPVTTDHVPACSPAVGDLDGDGSPEIVFESYSSLWAWHADGNVVAGFPVQLGANFSYASPALADLDGDGDREIAVSQTGTGAAAWVLHHDGTAMAGWPKTFGNWSYCPPSLVDVDADGAYEVLASREGGGPNVFFCWSDAGALKFAYSAVAGGGGGPITATDLDGDGLPEIFTDHNTMAGGQGYLIGVDSNGNDLPGFPLRPFGFTYMNGAQIADVDGDGDVELGVLSSHDGLVEVNLFDLPSTWAPGATPWPTYHAAETRGGLDGSANRLHLQGTPSIGTSVVVTTVSEPGDSAFVAAAFSTGHFPLAGFGWIGLGLFPTPLLVTAQTVPGAGQASFALPIPPDPSGVGVAFYLQALTSSSLALGGSFTNVVGKVIQP